MIETINYVIASAWVVLALGAFFCSGLGRFLDSGKTWFDRLWAKFFVILLIVSILWAALLLMFKTADALADWPNTKVDRGWYVSACIDSCIWSYRSSVGACQAYGGGEYCLAEAQADYQRCVSNCKQYDY